MEYKTLEEIANRLKTTGIFFEFDEEGTFFDSREGVEVLSLPEEGEVSIVYSNGKIYYGLEIESGVSAQLFLHPGKAGRLEIYVLGETIAVDVPLKNLRPSTKTPVNYFMENNISPYSGKGVLGIPEYLGR